MTVDVKPGSENRHDLRRSATRSLARHQVVTCRLRRTVATAKLPCILVEQRGSRKGRRPPPSARCPGVPLVRTCPVRTRIPEFSRPSGAAVERDEWSVGGGAAHRSGRISIIAPGAPLVPAWGAARPASRRARAGTLG